MSFSSDYTTDSLKAELNARGWRMTPPRSKILQVFQNLPKGKHLSAEELSNLSVTMPMGSVNVYFRSQADDVPAHLIVFFHIYSGVQTS